PAASSVLSRRPRPNPSVTRTNPVRPATMRAVKTAVAAAAAMQQGDMMDLLPAVSHPRWPRTRTWIPASGTDECKGIDIPYCDEVHSPVISVVHPVPMIREQDSFSRSTGPSGLDNLDSDSDHLSCQGAAFVLPRERS